MIRITDLTCRYGAHVAVDAVDLHVAEGELFGLLGPNGAGKTTTIEVLTTLRRPDAGCVELDGVDVLHAPRAARERLGIVFQESGLDLQLTVAENCAFHGAMYGMSRRDVRARLDVLLELFGIADRRDTQVRALSGGLRRRAEIARSLLHAPRVLVLDEPTVGLDPAARRVVGEQLALVRRELGTTVLVTTHYLAEAEPFDRVAILHEGRLVALDAPTALMAEHGAATLDDVFFARTGFATQEQSS